MIGDRLRPYSINSNGADMTLELLANKMDSNDIIIPEFQRRHVWSIQKASKLIESFLLGLPVPQIFLYLEPETKQHLVVDGQQRLKAIHDFQRGIYKGREFRLTGLNSEWNGKTFNELSDPDKRRFRNAILRATIFEQVNPRDNTSIFEVFERLNTGGVGLTAQEVRNAVIGGDLNALIKRLSDHPSWIALNGAKKSDDRYRSTELILRLIALSDTYETYKRPMNIFLSDYLEEHKSLEPEVISAIEKEFIETIEVIQEEISVNAFKINKSVSASLSDAVYVGVARNRNNLTTDLKKHWHTLVSDPTFQAAVSRHTTDTENIITRITLAINLFKR